MRAPGLIRDRVGDGERRLLPPASLDMERVGDGERRALDKRAKVLLPSGLQLRLRLSRFWRLLPSSGSPSSKAALGFWALRLTTSAGVGRRTTAPVSRYTCLV